MNLTLLIFSLLTRNIPQMLNQYSSNFNKRPTNLLSGYDHRHLITTTNSTSELCCTFNATNNTTSEKMYNFKKMFAQLATLNYLKRQDVSEVNKLNAIENHEQQFNDKTNTYKPNLLEGGLFKDWDWDWDWDFDMDK